MKASVTFLIASCLITGTATLAATQEVPHRKDNAVSIAPFPGEIEFDSSIFPKLPDLLLLGDQPAPSLYAPGWFLSGPGFNGPWNSVLLFFNLGDDVEKPVSYQVTTSAIAQEVLDEGSDPADVPISEFMENYWRALSNDNISFGVDTARRSNGEPRIPVISPPGGPYAWQQCVNLCLKALAAEIWEASGGLLQSGKRLIPSVVLMQNFKPGVVHGSRSSFAITVDGQDYIVGAHQHMHLNLVWASSYEQMGTAADGRMIWGRMCHEYGHNFLNFGDLYGGSGCTGYWDLMGDGSQPTRMSEVSSYTKELVGWLAYREVIEGPEVPTGRYELRPYTTTGDALKVVPSPEKNPDEFFLLEYRKSTGDEVWRPDGALQEQGLLITHINTRMIVNRRSPVHTALLRDAPFFDPEYADFSDNGGTLWQGYKQMNGALYPQSNNDEFTPSSSPNSDFYGGLPSGLSITNIRTEGDLCVFNLEIDNFVRQGWRVESDDKLLVGRFFNDTRGGTEQILLRNDDRAALLIHRQSQWHIERRQEIRLGDWALGGSDRAIAGDLDGDGLDEVYMSSASHIGLVEWRNGRFQSVTVQRFPYGNWFWRFTGELTADLDGDGADEIFVHIPGAVGMLKLVNSKFQVRDMRQGRIGSWVLLAGDEFWVGRFSEARGEEVLVKNGPHMGLIRWSARQGRLVCKRITFAGDPYWVLNANQDFEVGDFDGDGWDEVYIRTTTRAGVLKMIDGRFRLVWQADDTLPVWNGSANLTVELQEDDCSFAGRFRHDRDAVLHCSANGMAMLHWLNGQMVVRHKLGPRLGGLYPPGIEDRIFVGQFMRGGPDTAQPHKTQIQPGLDGVFLHSSWGTGGVSVNCRPVNENVIKEEMKLTWIREQDLLFGR